MRRAVDGRFKVVFFATALPPLKVVTVTLATGVFLTALGVAFAVVEVLRVPVSYTHLTLPTSDLV